MKRALLLLLLIIRCFALQAQQDVQFSQYYFNGLFINPAYAGYQERVNLQSTFRYQWTGINGAPRSGTLSVDASVKDDNVGLAFQILSDNLGAQQNTSVYANYAYRKLLDDENESRLAFGLGVGMLQMKLDPNKIDPLDIGDPQIPNYLETRLLPDAKAGVYLSNQKYYVGFSVDNLISGYLLKNKVLNYTVITPRPHYYLSAGIITPINESIQLKPFFLLKDDVNGPTSLDLNAFFLFNERFWLGAGYRTGVKIYNKKSLDDNVQNANSVMAMAEFYVSKNLRIGYSFDQNTGALRGLGGGIHEISVGFGFRNYAENRYYKCWF